MPARARKRSVNHFDNQRRHPPGNLPSCAPVSERASVPAPKHSSTSSAPVYERKPRAPGCRFPAGTTDVETGSAADFSGIEQGVVAVPPPMSIFSTRHSRCSERFAPRLRDRRSRIRGAARRWRDKIAQRLRERHHRRASIAGFALSPVMMMAPESTLSGAMPQPDIALKSAISVPLLLNHPVIDRGKEHRALPANFAFNEFERGTCDTAARLTSSRWEKITGWWWCRYRYRRSIAGECSRFASASVLVAVASSFGTSIIASQSPLRRRSTCRQSSGRSWRHVGSGEA